MVEEDYIEYLNECISKSNINNDDIYSFAYLAAMEKMKTDDISRFREKLSEEQLSLFTVAFKMYKIIEH